MTTSSPRREVVRIMCVTHLTATTQSKATLKVRRSTYELVEFLHDVLKVREFPWAKFPHAVGLHNGCASLRALRTAKMSEIDEPFFSKPLELLSKVKGIRFVTPERPDECWDSVALLRL